jgi:spermidine/putrescine transport system substrate-binding protein
MGKKEGIRILASEGTALSRRSFLTGALGVGAGLTLAACSGGGNRASSTTSAAASGSAAPTGALRLYGWADYTDPQLFEKFQEQTGLSVTVDAYSSNEEAITRLSATKGDSGYDLLVPSGVYIPQMVALGLLQPLDVARLKNFSNVQADFTDRAWDAGNQHSVPKNIGICGWMYDSETITTPITTWNDFISVMQGPASGQTSLLDTPGNLAGIYFWANGIDWTTTSTADLDACEAFVLNEIAPHVKSFDSYAARALVEGNYLLSQTWNGDARFGLVDNADAARYTWSVGAPATEIWMDNWAIVAGAKNPDAAYAWIDFILDPANSLVDLQFHGYDTGITGVAEQAKAQSLPLLDMVFPTAGELARAQYGAINEAQDRLVDIWNKAKAAAGG